MEKIYTNSKMIKYEHTWIVEPTAFETHCPRCEVVTGATKWEINCCTAGAQSDDQNVYCRKCYGPYIRLLSDQSKDVIIGVHEEGSDQRVFLERHTYRMNPNDKLCLMVHGTCNYFPTEDRSRVNKRRKIVSFFSFYDNITMNYDVSYVL